MKFEGAACVGADIRIFYRTGTNTAPMALCAVCPAREECLSHALQYEEFGVWGGTTAKERRQMREEMNIALKNLAEEAVVVKTHPFCGLSTATSASTAWQRRAMSGSTAKPARTLTSTESRT